MAKSSVYPSLERKPGGPDNWIEATGGLPKYIERIAKHLHYEQGMSISKAIASAVNTVKRWARMGKVAKHGDPHNKHVSAATAAKAAKAVAEWETKRASARAGRGARIAARRSIKLATPEGEHVNLKALVERAKAITDPERKARVRERILALAKQGEIDLALPAKQKCHYCKDRATKRVIHSEGMAYLPCCDAHEAKAKDDAAHSTPDGTRDDSNINGVKDIPAPADLAAPTGEAIDLALTKDGRKSFKNRGKWRHGFVPLDEEAKTAKAKGSPIAMRRMNRLFGGGGGKSKPPKPIRVKGKTGGTEKVDRLAQARNLDPKDSNASQRVKPPSLEASRGRRPTKRSEKSWEEIPDAQKTVRNGKRYVLTTFKGKTMLTEWTGGSQDAKAPNLGDRRLRAIQATDVTKLTTGRIKRLLEVAGQDKAVRARLNKELTRRKKLAKKA